MGKFELFEDKLGEWRFNLVAGNGEVIAVSQGYTSEAGARNGIKSVKKNALFASVVEVKKDV